MDSHAVRTATEPGKFSELVSADDRWRKFFAALDNLHSESDCITTPLVHIDHTGGPS